MMAMICAPVALPGIGTYTARGARDFNSARRLIALLARRGDLAYGRDPSDDHITGSAFVVNETGTRLLMMHHTKLDRWLQLGGHCDAIPDVRQTALREAHEESGLKEITPVGDDILDIDAHLVPARNAEPAHVHFDVRFLFVASDATPLLRNAESRALAWIAIADLAGHNASESITFLRDIDIPGQVSAARNARRATV